MAIGNNIRAGSAYVEVTANTSKLQRNLTSAQAQLQAFGKTCTDVGRDLLMLSGAMSLPLILAAKSFAGFDDSMRLVQAVTQATNADFKELTITAQRLGRETSYTAQQVADAMVSLGRMGFSPKEIQAAIADVLNLARATGTELAEAGDIAANSMRIFGIEAENMSDVADVLTVTANSSAQTLIDLFEALKMGGPQAAAAGESIRETCASLAILANLGIKGSLAGTALRKSFSQFSKVKVQEQLRAVGVETVDASGNLRKMADIMRDIAKVMQTMPTAEKLAFAEEIFDIRGSLAGLTLTANTDDLDAMIEKLMDVEGAAAETAQKMDAGLGGSFRLLMSAVEGALNAIAAAMNSTLQPFINKVTDVINVFTKWIERNQGLVTTFAVLVAGAAALGVALIAVGIAAKGVAAGIAVVQVVTKGFALAQGMCVAAAVALKNSFALIAQAFISYRTVTIPALVGTEQFCAALGLASTAANRACASIILMSNAEAAAAVKSAIVAKWHAMVAALTALRNSTLAATIATKAHAVAEMALGAKTAIVQGWLAMTAALKGLTLASIASAVALKAQAIAESAMTAGRAIAAAWHAMTTALSGLTMATISATIATKAHTAAEAICAAGTAALNTVRKAGVAIMAMFTAATLKSTLAVSAAAVGNFLLATAAKVAAVAMVALSAVMSFIANHPVMASFLALGAVLIGVCIYMSKTASYTAKLSDEASKLRAENDKLRKSDIIRMKRLTQLSQKQNLTNAEMAEARVLAQKLQEKYGDLGISIQDGATRLEAFATAASRLNSLDLRIDDPTDQVKLDRLKELSVKVTLEAEEESEAQQLIDDLSEKYGDLGVVIDLTTGKLTALSEASSRLESIELKIAEPDMPDFARLQELTIKPELDAAELDESELLINNLSRKYGDLGVIVDRSARKISHLNTVAANLQRLSVRVDGEEDLERVTRLMQLAKMPKLDSTSLKEATELVNSLQSRYGDLGIAIDAAQMRIVELTDAQRQFAEATRIVESGDDPLKDKHLAMLQRLKDLGEQERLTNEEQTEARQIVNELTDAYGELGINIGAIAGKLNMATGAQQKFNKAMKEAALMEIDAEIAEIEANTKELNSENASYLNYFNMNLFSQLTGKVERNLRQMEANNERIVANGTRIIALRKRRRALAEQESDEALTGEDINDEMDDESVEERYRQEEAKKQQAEESVANAERRMREIEERIARERRTELQNEIHDIKALRDEYKQLIREQLKAEYEKPAKERNHKKIRELQSKIRQANADADQRIAEAKKKAEEEFKAEVESLQERFTQKQEDIKRRRELEEQDRELDKQLKEDPAKAIRRIKQLIRQYEQEADDARREFDDEVRSAQADGKIDDDERRRIEDADKAYTRAESLVDKYSSRLREAQSGTKKAAEETKRSTNGSFYAAALEARVNRSLAERTAKASEAIVANTKRTNDLLKNQSGTTTQTFK